MSVVRDSIISLVLRNILTYNARLTIQYNNFTLLNVLINIYVTY